MKPKAVILFNIMSRTLNVGSWYNMYMYIYREIILILKIDFVLKLIYTSVPWNIKCIFSLERINFEQVVCYNLDVTYKQTYSHIYREKC